MTERARPGSPATGWRTPPPPRATSSSRSCSSTATTCWRTRPTGCTTCDWLTHVLGRAGHPVLAGELSSRELPRLRRLRDALRRSFEAGHDGEAAAILNPLLRKAVAVPLIDVDPTGAIRCGWGSGSAGSRPSRRACPPRWRRTSPSTASDDSASAAVTPADACSWTAPGQARASTAAATATTVTQLASTGDGDHPGLPSIQPGSSPHANGTKLTVLDANTSRVCLIEGSGASCSASSSGPSPRTRRRAGRRRRR